MLVGRDRELHCLCQALARAREGVGSVLALVGAPGIGKTRLADEVAERASRDGFGVHWGRAWETGGAPAYWPWTEVLRSLSPAGSPPGTAPPLLLGPAEHPVPAERARADPREERFRLHEAVAASLRAGAGAALSASEEHCSPRRHATTSRPAGAARSAARNLEMSDELDCAVERPRRLPDLRA